MIYCAFLLTVRYTAVSLIQLNTILPAWKAFILQSVSVPVPGWCKQRSAGTQRPPWPSSEWPAPSPLSHRPPARWRLRSYTAADKRRSGGGLVNEKWTVNEGRLDFCNPPHNHRECFFINIWPASSVTANVGWQTSVITQIPCRSFFRGSRLLLRVCFHWKPELLLLLRLHATCYHVHFLSRRPSTSLHFHPHCLLIKIQLISEWLCVEM